MPHKTLHPTHYLNLPERCYALQDPLPVAAAELLGFNDGLAKELGLDGDWWQSEQGLAVFAGNTNAEGCTPLAQAYAGHQFGGFSPQLGDGRALLIGEAEDTAGKRYDIQLKGSGRTPFSRNGDGRSALGPVVREYIMSEAMHALGVPTTRALAMVKTGERVQRETGLDGGILTRVASSHMRVGSFEFFASKGDADAVKSLADYAIARHYPYVKNNENKYLSFYESVIDAQASLVAKWMNLGFIHGVMNTDNVTISGEVIDYGPCAFMEHYDPTTCFSSIDRQGRYAYGNQPPIAHWNLAALGECLVSLFDDDMEKAGLLAEEALNRFPERFGHYWMNGMRAKLGLHTEQESDRALMSDWLGLMQRHGLDYTNSFNALSWSVDATDDYLKAVDKEWFVKWREHLNKMSEGRMKAANPTYIPRNHRVEEAIAAAYEGDMSVCERLMKVLATPYDEQLGAQDYALPAPDGAPLYQTFCGT